MREVGEKGSSELNCVPFGSGIKDLLYFFGTSLRITTM